MSLKDCLDFTLTHTQPGKTIDKKKTMKHFNASTYGLRLVSRSVVSAEFPLLTQFCFEELLEFHMPTHPASNNTFFR